VAAAEYGKVIILARSTVIQLTTTSLQVYVVVVEDSNEVDHHPASVSAHPRHGLQAAAASADPAPAAAYGAETRDAVSRDGRTDGRTDRRRAMDKAIERQL